MPLASLEKQITTAVETLSESVVSIKSQGFESQFPYGLMPVEGAGSGVIIDKSGYIITNFHVINKAQKVQIGLTDGRSFIGTVVGGDPSTDIALIKVDGDSLPAATLGDSDKLKVGMISLAIGNALGLPGAPTVSAGVISALGRPLPGADFIFEGLIQTDAAINPGNSGGPLANLKGEVIGINTAMIAYAQGVGFAIPSNTVKWVIEQISAKGRVVRPWIGVYGITLTPPIARRLNITTETGVLVVGVVPKGPAHESGIKVGDIIKDVESCWVRQMKDLLASLSAFGINEKIMLTYYRDGRIRQVLTRLLELPKQIAK